MGYVERNASGRTELRVHGVAGTAPESVLQHPHAEQVAGNRDAGFFRRWWEAQSVSADSPQRRREAYSWGGLTSGDNLRALWLLLLPFMLLNVAFYMAPYRRPPEPDEPTGWRERWTVWRRGWWSTPRRDRRRDRFSASVQRLLALSFTVTFTLTAITVAMDLVGWKCAAPATGDVCGTSWLGWLDAAWLRDRPGRQVAVTALLPLAMVGLLWWLAGATWDKLERVRPPASDTAARPVEIETPLEDRAMWNGRGPVRRLRAVHVATGLALPGVFALAPVQANSAWRPTVLLALVAFLVAMVVVVAHPTIAHRERPSRDTGKEDDDERRSPFRFLPWCALALTVLGLAVAATGTVAATGMPAPAGTAEVRSTLPWLAGALQGTFLVQAVLLALLLAACWSLRRRARRAAADDDTGEKRRVGLRPAWRGYAMPAIALLAWVLAGGVLGGHRPARGGHPRDARRPRVPGRRRVPPRRPAGLPVGGRRRVRAGGHGRALRGVRLGATAPVEAGDDRCRAGLRCRGGGGGREAHRGDRPSVGPGDAPDRRGAAGARFPAGRDRGRRAGGRRVLRVLPGTAG